MTQTNMTEIQKFLQDAPRKPTIEHFKNVDGLEMGVFNNGVTFLSERGLAQAAGVDKRSVSKHANNCKVLGDGDQTASKATSKLLECLQGNGFSGGDLFVPVKHKGKWLHAYPKASCMGILEYFAYESNERREQAKNSLRMLSRQGFDNFVFEGTGYKPQQPLPQPSTSPIEERLNQLGKLTRYTKSLGLSKSPEDMRLVRNWAREILGGQPLDDGLATPEPDPRFQQIQTYLDSLTTQAGKPPRGFNTTDICQGALGLNRDQVTREVQAYVRGSMESLGWTYKVLNVGGKAKKGWVQTQFKGLGSKSLPKAS